MGRRQCGRGRVGEDQMTSDLVGGLMTMVRVGGWAGGQTGWEGYLVHSADTLMPT